MNEITYSFPILAFTRNIHKLVYILPHCEAVIKLLIIWGFVFSVPSFCFRISKTSINNYTYCTDKNKNY